MKTKNLLTAMVFLFIGMGIFLTACNESFEEIPEEAVLKMSETSCNDYEYAGETHNEVLQHVVNRLDEFEARADDIVELEEFTFNVLHDYCTSNGIPFPDELGAFQINGESIFDMDMSIESAIANNDLLNDYEKQILLNVFIEIQNADEMDINEVLQSISDTECAIVDDPQVENLESLMQVLSVGKSTFQMWYDYDPTGTTNSYRLIWLAIGAADVAGAGIGVTFLGVGAVPSAVLFSSAALLITILNL